MKIIQLTQGRHDEANKRDWYRLYRNGVLSDAPAEQRTESEAAEQNEAMAEAGLTSRWVKWDMEAE